MFHKKINLNKKLKEITSVSFVNKPFTAMLAPSISSINQHIAEIKKKAAEAFLVQAKNSSFKQTLNKIILNTKLIVRDSSNKKNQ